MHKYRITKYNPLFRDAEGRFTRDEWTSISDIGKVFENQELTIEMYKKTEDSYIKAVHLTMDFLNLPHLHARNIIKSFHDNQFLALINDNIELYPKDMLQYYFSTNNNEKITHEDIDKHCRLQLREAWGSALFYPQKCKLFIGYDYLMSIHSHIPLDPIFQSIQNLGLFVEEF
ncbi:hypothetical protein IHV09_08640 [Fictibacillus sp. 23RED33]|uniref:hypothetical protein n=1 Tax=Fictibacillus sp. 23RED33 TaxID=2745879 RepID=UPI0018CEE607|nr:hypothetical protein [Fictibacillus sp. 23RED33]MBH0173622.1 hypothetical protein [Fictibacillus sp. 23RED33]